MARVLAGTTEELPDGAQTVVELDRDEALVVNAGGAYFAVSNTCSHQELELCGGRLEGRKLQCAHHGSWFDLETGRALNLPAFRPVATYRTVLEDGRVFVETEDD